MNVHVDHCNQNVFNFQDTEFSARFCFPFALELCKGSGADIGCGKVEWALPGAFPIDPKICPGHTATSFPELIFDYIFSSHCLEHLDDWVIALQYWEEHLKPGGILFLYLPHYNRIYWRPWNNREHKHIFTPEIITDYLKTRNFKNVFASGRDLNDSFTVVAEKM